jgi:D-amino-acid dehydrogenase
VKVCVIGAGVVGCATAYQLALAGHEVVLVESASSPASGASHANGAQLSYSYVDPLASPSTLRSLPALLLDREKAVLFQPRWSITQLRWILAFLLNCSPCASLNNTRRLLALSKLSQAALDRWCLDDGLDVEIQRNGKLVLCADSKSIDRQRRLIELKASSGYSQSLLDRNGCIEREPALANYSGFVGGVWTSTDCAVDPRTFCKVLVDRAQRLGAQVLWKTSVDDFVIKNGKVACAVSNAGAVVADAYVLATGIAAPRLAARLGETLSILPIKGYSITVPMKAGGILPLTSVTDLNRKTVLAPLGLNLRVAALAEVGAYDYAVPEKKLAHMVATVSAVYPGLCDLSDPQAWAGLRPATPSSVPVVRQARVTNAFLNVGHGALGLTLAAGSAVQIVEAIRDAKMASKTLAFGMSPISHS